MHAHQVGNALDDHVTTPCNPELLGSKEACYDSSIIAPGNVDHKWGAPEVGMAASGQGPLRQHAQRNGGAAANMQTCPCMATQHSGVEVLIGLSHMQ